MTESFRGKTKSSYPSNEQKVGNVILGRENISFVELSRSTYLSEREVLQSMELLQGEFGISGDKITGYKLSDDPEERLALAKFTTPPFSSRAMELIEQAADEFADDAEGLLAKVKFYREKLGYGEHPDEKGMRAEARIYQRNKRQLREMAKELESELKETF